MSEDKPTGDDKLMAYFMGQTNERLGQIESKLVELISFRSEIVATAKAEAKAEARSSSIQVSIISGILMILISFLMRKMGF